MPQNCYKSIQQDLVNFGCFFVFIFSMLVYFLFVHFFIAFLFPPVLANEFGWACSLVRKKFLNFLETNLRMYIVGYVKMKNWKNKEVIGTWVTQLSRLIFWNGTPSPNKIVGIQNLATWKYQGKSLNPQTRITMVEKFHDSSNWTLHVTMESLSNRIVAPMLIGGYDTVRKLWWIEEIIY